MRENYYELERVVSCEIDFENKTVKLEEKCDYYFTKEFSNVSEEDMIQIDLAFRILKRLDRDKE